MSCNTPIACDLTALNAGQDERRRVLATKLHSAIDGRRELVDGYALRLAENRASVEELHEWTALEGKCCPFLKFALVADGEELWLHLTGGTGVKEFLKAEMGI
jgi:hypothetical protein